MASTLTITERMELIQMLREAQSSIESTLDHLESGSNAKLDLVEDRAADMESWALGVKKIVKMARKRIAATKEG